LTGNILLEKVFGWLHESKKPRVCTNGKICSQGK